VAIDTQGFGDGIESNSQIVRKFAEFFHVKHPTVRGIALVINGQADRLTESIKSLIAFIYNAFGGAAVANICVVFTKCRAILPNEPNRQQKRDEYGGMVRALLKQLHSPGQVPAGAVPVYFVDSLDQSRDPSQETPANFAKFDEWLSKQSALPTTGFQEVQVGGLVVNEIEKGVKVPGGELPPDGDGRVYHEVRDMMRTKTVPWDGRGRVPFSEWREVPGSRTKRLIETRRRETRSEKVGREGPNGSGQVHDVMRELERKRIHFEDGRSDCYDGDWREVRRYQVLVETHAIERQSGEYDGHEVTGDGRYKWLADRQRTRITAASGAVSHTGWTTTRRWREPDMPRNMPVHRLFNGGSGRHLFTTNGGEVDHLRRCGWQYEGIAFHASEWGTAVHRLYKGGHMWVLEGERNALCGQGWGCEGVAWRIPPGGRTPVYRVYNPGSGDHLWTTNGGERDSCLRNGWRDEGVPWCV
jgi:hypothetical protein